MTKNENLGNAGVTPRDIGSGSTGTMIARQPSPGRLTSANFGTTLPKRLPDDFLFNGDCELMLDVAKVQGRKFQIIFTSPPYNLKKPYSTYADDKDLPVYLEWQRRIITKCVERLEDGGSICWQVGNYVSNGHIIPLDLELNPIFRDLKLQLRNRVVWHFGHGLHCKRRFSGRYEVVLWYTKTDEYKFNLDAVRIKPKYPHKKYYKGPKKGQLSCNPLGKNPDDVWAIDRDLGDFWEIPNVKHNHTEKTKHPCQFPIALAQRFVAALSDPGDSVFDPFLGVGSTAAAAALLGRHFFGAELNPEYFKVARDRVEKAAAGILPFRDANKPIYTPPTQREPINLKLRAA